MTFIALIAFILYHIKNNNDVDDVDFKYQATLILFLTGFCDILIYILLIITWFRVF